MIKIFKIEDCKECPNCYGHPNGKGNTDYRCDVLDNCKVNGYGIHEECQLPNLPYWELIK